MIPNSEKKSNTVRISKKDLLNLLSENEELKATIIALEAKLDAAIDLAADFKSSNEELAKLIEELESKSKDEELPSPQIYNPNIYFDGGIDYK